VAGNLNASSDGEAKCNNKTASLTPKRNYAKLLRVIFMTRRSATVIDAWRLFCVSSVLCGLLTTAAWAQRSVMDNAANRHDVVTDYHSDVGTGVLVFTVFAVNTRTHLDRQALLRLVNHANQATNWQTTEETSQGVFTNIPFGSYAVEVSAVGYLSTQKELQVMSSARPAEIDIVLQRDPSAINLDVADSILSAKARKETKRAVSALKSGNFNNAQKQLDEAYKSAPSSANLNFLLGYLYFQKKDFEKASNYLGTATSLNPRDAQALTLLGRAGLERQDYVAARSALEQAVAADADNWLPHNLLADSYLRQKNYDKARDEAQVAIAKSKTEASPAQLVLGQALVGLGLDQQGIQALDTFLKESPRHPMVGQVRGLIAEIRERESAGSSTGTAVKSDAALAGMDPLQALTAPRLPVKSWQPPSIDETKVVLAPGVACPSEKVVEETGKHVQELIEDVTRFSAVEDIFHQSLDEFGNPIRTETRKYNYVASISEPEPGSLAVDEYRADKLDLKGYPDQIASTGFAALALVFHPDMRDNFDMSCEGLGDWHGQAIWLVRFRQRRDKPSRMHSYKVGNFVYTVDLRGRAWITADKFQIVRIESELVRPMPEIKLLSEHQVVEYGPIQFDKKNTSLWLPKSAEIYFDFRRHRYYRRHSFDHYMLFSTDTVEKRSEPKAVSPDGKANPMPN
jgi:tetratricopeptide (TPR) repeat protein